MQSVESTSSQTSPHCLNFADDESEVFQSEDERSEVTGGQSRSALSSSSSGLGWSSTESEHEKEEMVGGTQGDLLFAQKVRTYNMIYKTHYIFIFISVFITPVLVGDLKVAYPRVLFTSPCC